MIRSICKIIANAIRTMQVKYCIAQWEAVFKKAIISVKLHSRLKQVAACVETVPTFCVICKNVSAVDSY